MKLEGIHHITAITADAPNNVRFYAGTLGLRLVKRSVNQDDPTVYHLFFADEKGSPGSDITFFEYRGIPQGRAGDGMIHRIVWRVGSPAALDFWDKRLSAHRVETLQEDRSLHFEDPEGLALELRVSESNDPPLIAESPDIPREYALQGFDGVRAYSSDPEASSSFLGNLLGFESDDGRDWTSRGETRGSLYVYDDAPSHPGLSGAGTVHHVAWSCGMQQHETWRQRIKEAGVNVTPIIDRYYFKSIYFHEPAGVLFEIATLGPGFSVDESSDSLGERLALPPRFEPLRQRLEEVLTPLPSTR